MEARLRAVTREEFDWWKPEQEKQYAEMIAASGRMSRPMARERARIDSARWFPQGLGSPGQYVYRVLAGEDPVGWLWLGESPDDRSMAWVYDVHVDPAQRGKGYGRQAMLLAEQEARALGMTSIGLNVHGQNTVARSLYDSLGYQVMSLQMRKPL